MYGGTERVVSFLTEELVAQGHDVTLFASGDSQTTARLVPGSKTSLRLSGNCVDHLAHHVAMLDDVMRLAAGIHAWLVEALDAVERRMETEPLAHG